MASNCSCEHNLINTSKTKKKPQLSLRLKKPWYIYIFFSSCETYNRSWSLKSSELRAAKWETTVSKAPLRVCPLWWFDQAWLILIWLKLSEMAAVPCSFVLFIRSLEIFSTEVDANSLGHASYLQFWFLLDAARQRSPARSFMDGNYARVAVIALAEK